MKARRKILRSSVVVLSALTGVLTSPGEELQETRTHLVKDVKEKASTPFDNPDGVPIIGSCDDYENNTVPSFWYEENPKKIYRQFQALDKGETINLALKITGTPATSSSPLKIDLEWEGDFTGKSTYSMELTSKPTSTEKKDSTGNLSVISKADEWGIRFKAANCRYMGTVRFTITLGGSDAMVYMGSAYKGDTYKGFIAYNGAPHATIPDYQVGADGNVTIKASPDNPLSPFTLQEGILAYDEYDKEYITPEPVGDGLKTYTEQWMDGFKVGDTFKIEFQASDKSGNITKIIVTIKYVDDVAPTIEVPELDDQKRIPVPYSKARTDEALEATLQSMIKVTDNIRDGIIPKIDVKDFKPLIMGDYKVNVEANDGYNTSTWSGTINVYDDVAPDIEGASTITTAVTAPLTAQGIIDQYTVIDEIDGEDVTISLSDDEYHEKTNSVTVGTYTATIVASDSSGNTAEKVITIAVEDQEGPVWYVYGTVLTILEQSKLSPMEIVQRLVDEGSIDDLNYARAEIVLGDPIDGRQTPGNYLMTIKAETDDGTTRFVNLTLSVLARNDSIIEPNPPKKLNRFFQFFVDLWNSIVKFFNKLFGKA